MIKEDFLPAAQLWASPVAIDALDAGYTVLGDFFEEALHDCRRGVVSIDQDCKPPTTGFCC